MQERNTRPSPEAARLAAARYAVNVEIDTVISEMKSARSTREHDYEAQRRNRLEGMREALRFVAGEPSEIMPLIARHPRPKAGN